MKSVESRVFSYNERLREALVELCCCLPLLQFTSKIIHCLWISWASVHFNIICVKKTFQSSEYFQGINAPYFSESYYYFYHFHFIHGNRELGTENLPSCTDSRGEDCWPQDTDFKSRKERREP